MQYSPPWLSLRSRKFTTTSYLPLFRKPGPFSLLTIGLGLFLAQGCVTGPAPYLPDTWIKQTSDGGPPSSETRSSRLQVLIMYSGITSSHSALRILKTDGHQVFWDPAGDFARFEYPSQYDHLPSQAKPRRVRDIIVENPPDLPTFLRWRWEVADTSVEVFEWNVTDHQAERLSQILLTGKTDPWQGAPFSSSTWPAFCTVTTSEFLARFGSPEVQISDWYFFPHSLAEALYQQSPDRVIVFTPNTQASLYRPPATFSVQQTPQ